VVDWARMSRVYPKQKAALTRALKKADKEQRRDAVIKACTDAVREWEQIGVWPDNWSRWQRALCEVGLQLQLDSLKDARPVQPHDVPGAEELHTYRFGAMK
jgi:hypothetical protein